MLKVKKKINKKKGITSFKITYSKISAKRGCRMLQCFQNLILNFHFSQQLSCSYRAIMWYRRYEIPFASCVHSLLCGCHQVVSVMQNRLNDISQIFRLTTPQSNRYRHYFIIIIIIIITIIIIFVVTIVER